VTELIWSLQALADVEEIRTYIALDSRAYADLTAQRIVAAVERQSPKIREVIAGRFRIVYRRRAQVVEIVTVFRGSLEFPDQALQ
jgi:plasmid stabilization system protein ParE